MLGKFSDPALQARSAAEEQPREDWIRSASPTPAIGSISRPDLEDAAALDGPGIILFGFSEV